MHRSERRAAGDTVWLADWIGSIAMPACQAAQSFRDLVGCPQTIGGALHCLPDARRELQRGEILGNVVKPAEERKRIAQCGQRSGSKTCRYSQPLLLSQSNQHAILNLREVHADRRASPGGRHDRAGHLDYQVSPSPQLLGLQIALI